MSTSRRMNRGGSPTAERLSARTDRGNALHRRWVPGGEVFGGDLANRALKTLGARAMTVDSAIIVGDGFDPNKAEDRALYAHEKYHLDHSGGHDENSGRDHEEVAARAVERMVLHMADGGYESHDAQAAVDGKKGGTSSSFTPAGGSQIDKLDLGAVKGYLALRAKGVPHQQIVQMIAKEVITGITAQREQGASRFSDKKGFQ